MSTAAFASQVQGLLQGTSTPAIEVKPSVPTPAEPPKPVLDPLQLLAILQREGRLVDFLMEDIQGLPDAQIGAAVREVHLKCRKALQDHVPLAAVVETAEDEKMTVSAGYDPSAIRVVGNLGSIPLTPALFAIVVGKRRVFKYNHYPAGRIPVSLRLLKLK